MLSPGNGLMYCLADGLERAFIKEELMPIPKTQSCLPNTSKNGDNKVQLGSILK